MSNPIGIISMQFVRPFTVEHLGLFEHIRALGFDFIELLVPEPGEFDLATVRGALATADLGVVLAARVSLERDLASADPERSRAGIAYLEHCIAVAEALDARIVGGPLYGAPLVFAGRAPAPVEEGERLARLERCVAGLRAVAPRADSAGVTLAVEPLNRFETDAVSTVRQGLTLIAAVDRPAVGLMLDTFHMHMEERSLAEAIREAGPHVRHFQANENHRGFIGTGSTDWLSVCRALSEIGYAGPISVEPFRRDDDRFGVPIALWRPPHEDESEKLRQSLALLRSALSLAGSRR